MELTVARAFKFPGTPAVAPLINRRKRLSEDADCFEKIFVRAFASCLLVQTRTMTGLMALKPLSKIDERSLTGTVWRGNQCKKEQAALHYSTWKLTKPVHPSCRILAIYGAQLCNKKTAIDRFLGVGKRVGCSRQSRFRLWRVFARTLFNDSVTYGALVACASGVFV